MNPLERRRRRVAIEAAMVCIIILLMVQIWLLTATLEAYLAGHHDTVLPAFLVSVAITAVAAALYLMVVRIDRARDRRAETGSTSGPWQLGDRHPS